MYWEPLPRPARRCQGADSGGAMKRFSTDISYYQINVHWKILDRPFNDWRDEHIAQGFSWRPGSVSFSTFAEGKLDVCIRFQEERTYRLDALRTIEVPFTVPAYTLIEVESMCDKRAAIDLDVGHYRLIFEHGYNSPPDPFHANEDMWADFTFIPVPVPVEPRIVRADPTLSPPTSLLMTADPA